MQKIIAWRTQGNRFGKRKIISFFWLLLLSLISHPRHLNSFPRDISKRNCILSFPASTNPIIQFLPVSLFNCQTNSPGFRYASVDEQVDQLLGATSLWFSERKETCSLLPSEQGDIAMWLLVSTASDVESSENCISGHCQINTAESWRLALLAKNNMIFGSPLNIRYLILFFY